MPSLTTAQKPSPALNLTENRSTLIRRLLAMTKTLPAHHPGLAPLLFLEPDFDHGSLAWKVLSSVERKLSNGVSEIRLVIEEDALRLEFVMRGDENWGLPADELRSLLRDAATDWVMGAGIHASYCDESEHGEEIVFFYAWDLYRVEAGAVEMQIRRMLQTAQGR